MEMVLYREPSIVENSFLPLPNVLARLRNFFLKKIYGLVRTRIFAEKNAFHYIICLIF